MQLRDRHLMTIVDGHGGSLQLDRSSPHVRWLAGALRRLATGQTPAGATLLKVYAGDDVYLLSCRGRDDGEALIQLSALFDPCEQVALSRDQAVQVATMLDDGAAEMDMGDLLHPY